MGDWRDYSSPDQGPGSFRAATLGGDWQEYSPPGKWIGSGRVFQDCSPLQQGKGLQQNSQLYVAFLKSPHSLDAYVSNEWYGPCLEAKRRSDSDFRFTHFFSPYYKWEPCVQGIMSFIFKWCHSASRSKITLEIQKKSKKKKEMYMSKNNSRPGFSKLG